MSKKYASLEERLDAWSVERDNGFCSPCRIWMGYAQNGAPMPRGKEGGYPRINMRYRASGEEKAKSRKYPAYWVRRVLYEISKIVPDFDSNNPQHMESFWDLLYAYRSLGLTIEHVCKHTLCINPLHLDWVPMAENNGRKRWSEVRRRSRIESNHNGVGRHAALIRNSAGVKEFIEKIKKSRHLK